MPGAYWDKQFNVTKGCEPISAGCPACNADGTLDLVREGEVKQKACQDGNT